MRKRDRMQFEPERRSSKEDAQPGVNLSADLLRARSKSTEPVSRANHPFFGFADLGDDREDDPPDPWAGGRGRLRSRRRWRFNNEQHLVS
jgi:hypothetical protein